jgi:hypothetical protein
MDYGKVPELLSSANIDATVMALREPSDHRSFSKTPPNRVETSAASFLQLAFLAGPAG